MLQAGNRQENLVSQWTESGQLAEKPMHFSLERYKEAYIAEWQHFVDVLNGAESACKGKDGEYALRLADAALESLRTGQTVQL